MAHQLWRAVDDYVQADTSSNKDTPTIEASLKTIHEALDSEKVQLLDLVVHLEKALSDPHTPQARRQATMLLAACLRGATEPRLNFKHAETLARFFASKLSDWQCVEGALKGILALLVHYGPQLRSLKGEEGTGEPIVAHIARSIFKDVSPPSHTQQVRKAAIDVVYQLLKDWREEVSLLGSQLGDGVSSVIEEERDPRNLLLSFTVSREVMVGDPSWVSEKTLETLFETLTSYFPITFQPPKDDKIGITALHLRTALGQALSASARFAKLLVPFLLDNAKDSLADGDDTIEQALELLTVCLEAYGPSVVQAHIREILPVVREQVCRTSSPCRGAFCSMLRTTLAVALRDVPAGLNPHWLELDVVPALKAVVFDAVRGEAVLPSEGSRHLLLAAAGAHPLLLRRIWSLALPRLLAPPATGPGSGLGPTEGQSEPGALPLEATDFVAGLTELLEASSRSGKAAMPAQRLQPTLAGSLQRLRLLQPETTLGAVTSTLRLLELVGRLCCLVGLEEVSDSTSASGSATCSFEAFSTLTILLLPRPPGPDSDTDLEQWATGWRRAFETEPGLKVCFEALVSALRRVLLEQQAAAGGLAQVLLACKPEQQPPLLREALPRLLTETGASLARSAADAGPDKAEAARQSARALLKGASDMLLAGATPQSLASVAESLQSSAMPAAALSWTASCLAESLGLLEGLTKLSGLLGTGSVPVPRTSALRSLVGALNRLLPQGEARSLRRRVLQCLTAAASPSGCEYGLCTLLMPAVLPGAADEEWSLCSDALKGLCSRDPLWGPEGDRESQERVAHEALRAAVEACPEAQLQHLLAHGLALPPEGGSHSHEQLSSWALRCWAAAAAALLQRGGCTGQAAGLLEALLSVLDIEDHQSDQAPAAPAAVQSWHVPLAFRDLLPPRFASGTAELPSLLLPPLALQQLSLTVLPALVSRTRSTSGLRHQAALESAVTLLCALPQDVVTSDCMEELRWCVLTSLRTLGQDPKGGASQAASIAIFAAQLLQLLVRAVSHDCPWIEDELHFIVSFLTGPGSSCEVPLVRLGSMQVLLKLVEGSRGHLAPFRRHIEQVTRRGIEDRVREVRLVAIACLNAWHCGASVES